MLCGGGGDSHGWNYIGLVEKELVFSPANNALTDQVAGIRRSLPSAFQQPNAIHENNGWNPVLTGGRKSVLQVLQPQATLESSNH